MRSPRLVTALTCLALATACGSTVQMTSTSTTLGSSDGTGSPLGGSGGGTGGGTTGIAPGASTGALPGTGTTGAGAVGAGATSTTGGTTPLVRGTNHVTSMRVGVIYLKGLDQAYAALGASSKSSDSQADYAAVFRYLNAKGGVKLEPF